VSTIAKGSGSQPTASGLRGRHAEFIQANTVLTAPSLVPELVMHLATSVIPFWQATENWLAEANVAAPFWAFAWPGGQALARHMLDNPHLVRGRRVLDFATGGGIGALAAARAGAASVDANDIDPMALAAVSLNALANGADVTTRAGDIVGEAGGWDLILAGDVCYEAPMTQKILPWLRSLARQAEIWIADPGRAYLPEDGMEALASYVVPTSLELEDRAERLTTIYRLHQTVPAA
jgi:predicted nicotinamide N-methyase